MVHFMIRKYRVFSAACYQKNATWLRGGSFIPLFFFIYVLMIY